MQTSLPAHRTACSAVFSYGRVRRLYGVVRELRLDDRSLPMCRAWEAEEELARMLLAAAWYAVAVRNSFAFVRTPLFLAAREAAADFTLQDLVALPHRDLVDDVTAQVRRAAEGDLAGLRARTVPERCTGGPVFPGAAISADADLVVDGLLLEVKSSRWGVELPQRTVHQLVGYLLLDRQDRYGIERVGLYLTRSGRLVSWRVEEMLELLGARRRDLGVLREEFAQLLEGCVADEVPGGPVDEERVLARVDAVLPPLGCPVCAQPLPVPAAGERLLVYCSIRCAGRAPFLSRRGWLLTPPPVTHQERPEVRVEESPSEDSPPVWE